MNGRSNKPVPLSEILGPVLGRVLNGEAADLMPHACTESALPIQETDPTCGYGVTRQRVGNLDLGRLTRPKGPDSVDGKRFSPPPPPPGLSGPSARLPSPLLASAARGEGEGLARAGPHQRPRAPERHRCPRTWTPHTTTDRARSQRSSSAHQRKLNSSGSGSRSEPNDTLPEGTR